MINIIHNVVINFGYRLQPITALCFCKSSRDCFLQKSHLNPTFTFAINAYEGALEVPLLYIAPELRGVLRTMSLSGKCYHLAKSYYQQEYERGAARREDCTDHNTGISGYNCRHISAAGDYRNSCRRGVVQIRPLYMGLDMHFLWDSCKHRALWRRIRIRRRQHLS